MKKLGFTLSEILITLGVIGVVAVLTLPTVSAKYQKKQTAIRLKQTYSLMSQAFKQAEIENGPMTDWSFRNANDFTEKYIKPYIKIVKEFDNYDGHIYCRNGENCDEYGKFNRACKIILANGTLLAINLLGASSDNIGITIIIDINATKGPNRYGRDVFMFSVDEIFGFVPYGMGRVAGKTEYSEPVTREDLIESWGDYRKCNSQHALYCAGVILMDNWEIADDYKW